MLQTHLQQVYNNNCRQQQRGEFHEQNGMDHTARIYGHVRYLASTALKRRGQENSEQQTKRA